MKLRLVISGGESGADLTALQCAYALGIPTGGFIYADYRNEYGENLDLRDLYNLRPINGNRTELNAAVGDCTVWFGFDPKTTGGGMNTKYGCQKWHRPMFVNPRDKNFIRIASTFEVINIAGNRESINPGVVGKVQRAFDALKPFWAGVDHGNQGEGGEVRDSQQGHGQGQGGAQPDWPMYRKG